VERIPAHIPTAWSIIPTEKKQRLFKKFIALSATAFKFVLCAVATTVCKKAADRDVCALMTTFRLIPLSASFISKDSTFIVLAKSISRTIHLFEEIYYGKNINVASPLHNVEAKHCPALFF
jgi:hypothetical protein